MDDKKPTLGDRLDKIETVLCNEIWHELRWHRWLLLIILAAIVGAGIASICTG